MQDRRSYVSQYTVLNLGVLVCSNVNERNGVQRVGSIRSTILIQSMVGITVVGDDDYFIIVCLAASTVSFTHSSMAFTAFSIAS